MDSRPGRRVRLSHRRAAGRQIDRGALRVHLRDEARPGPRGNDAGDAEPAAELRQPLSGRLVHPADPGEDDGEIPCRVDRIGRRSRQGERIDLFLRSHQLRGAGRFADPGGALRQDLRVDAARVAGRICRYAGRTGRDAGADRCAQAAGGTGRKGVRQPALRQVHVPPVDQRQPGRDRPRTSPVERERRDAGLLHPLERGAGAAQPAAARIHPQLERQVPPRGGFLDARFPHADAQFAAVGV